MGNLMYLRHYMVPIFYDLTTGADIRQFFCWFFEKFKNIKKTFWNYLTFRCKLKIKFRQIGIVCGSVLGFEFWGRREGSKIRERWRVPKWCGGKKLYSSHSEETSQEMDRALLSFAPWGLTIWSILLHCIFIEKWGIKVRIL